VTDEHRTSYLSLSFLVALLGCATALGQEPGRPELPVRDTVSQYGITWKLDRKVPVGQFVNGDYYVVGPVTVVDITPRPTLDRSGGVESRELLGANQHMQARQSKVSVLARNGSMLNLQIEKQKTGFDSRAPGNRFDADLFTPLPIEMKPGDSLISTISVDKVRVVPRMLRPSDMTISPVKVAAVLTCMDKPAAPDAFRPSYCDRSNRIYLARNLRRDLLPRLSLPAGVRKGAKENVHHRVAMTNWDPTVLANFARIFQRPWIDTVTFRFAQPVENMPDYGREIGRAVGISTLLLCCDFTPEAKEKLLVNIVQVGIDLWGVVRAGHGGWPAVGGFSHGRKWLIIFAGLMLGEEEMQSPKTTHPNVEFSEDGMTIYGKCWTGASVVYAGHHGKDGTGVNGPYEHLHPSKWPAMTGEGYRRCCTSIAWIGQALAIRIMHAEKLWDHDAFFDYADRWMTEDDTEHVAEIKAVTNTDYSAPYQRQKRTWDPFVNAMWAKYRNNLPRGQAR
jgi:hypothetical protein